VIKSLYGSEIIEPTQGRLYQIVAGFFATGLMQRIFGKHEIASSGVTTET
jgi:hypothetical protein